MCPSDEVSLLLSRKAYYENETHRISIVYVVTIENTCHGAILNVSLHIVSSCVSNPISLTSHTQCRVFAILTHHSHFTQFYEAGLFSGVNACNCVRVKQSTVLEE